MASDAINTLQLKITNDATDAVKSVDKLIKRVEKLKESVSESIETPVLDKVKKSASEASAAAETISKSTKKITSSVKESASSTAKLADSFKSVFGKVKGIFGKVGEVIARPFQKAHKSIKTLFSSIGRIAFYRLIRSAIREVTQGFSEGIKHLYAWSEAFNTKFAPTMDMFKTQMTYLKNGFASMFSPLIEWVVPNVIVPLTDAMVELFNLIQQGFAVLVGHDYWYKAQKSMQKFGEATGKANIQLAKFDELNNLTETGSGANDDASGMFTLEKVQNTFSNGLFKTIRDSIKKGDWFSVGKVIADGINKGIKNFDAIGIAESIAETINNAFDMLAGLGATMNWEQIGRKLGDFIDTLFKKVNWTQMGKAVGSVAGGIARVFLQAIANIDIESVFNAIFSLLSGLIQGIGDALFEDDGYLAKKLGLQFAKTLLLAVKYGIQAWNNLQDSNIFSTGEVMFMKTLGIDKGSLGTYKNAMNDITFNAILKPINDTMNTLDKNHEKFLAEQKTTTVNSLNHMLDGVNLTWQGQNIGNQIMNGINSAINGSQIAASFGSHTVEIAFGAARGGFIPMANGGTLSQGTLFAAGEVPGQAEMVGNINGRTGVASGYEITGIRDAVLSTGEAEVQLLNRLIQALERKNLVISPSAQLGRVVAQSNRLYGAVTG